MNNSRAVPHLRVCQTRRSRGGRARRRRIALQAVAQLCAMSDAFLGNRAAAAAADDRCPFAKRESSCHVSRPTRLKSPEKVSQTVLLARLTSRLLLEQKQ